jgi:hypothetical protein
MAAAHNEHLAEAAKDPSIKKQNRAEFLSAYGPATDDDSLIDFFARKSHQNRSGIVPRRKR